ncbi:YwqI/YxiC family protein [Metabacillus sp. KIGAM252]|uniref:YwqI/YxiC family protein n=1 Tax=Metabacillus flavus TaxID=2823519 RepID=A0ABS5LAX8_9BACI|nr:YwqI/YxiC family protein [Metabacillus flavus]MBS2967609.1 YwqI/YxiC family protein [Metabacillus flavus]
MSSEIKIVYGEAEQGLQSISIAAKAFKPSAEDPISGNTLDVVTELTDLSSRLEKLLVTYHSILIQNVETTRQCIAYMKNADDTASTTIRRSGPLEME